MKKLSLLLLCVSSLCLASVAGPNAEWLRDNYTKREVYIPARDGVRLHASVYEPADSLPHPVIIIRTPYGIGPYGEEFAGSLGSWMRMYSLNRYIIVFQSVRGTYLSEGDYENIRPLKPIGSEYDRTDEATDTFDTVEWLLRHTRTNGAVGVKGVSYPGFYATLAGLCGHPAVKAVSPQAPVTDWWRGDDVFRARYRHSLSAPEPVTPGERTAIDFTLNDIAHIFRKGHRIVVQIQSSWFPLMAMSPQFFQDNPYTVRTSDYLPCEIKVWSDSRVVIPAS